MTDETDIVVEEYEEVIGNLDELSDRVEIEDTEAESIQELTSIDRRNLTTHTGRPSLRSTNARLAGSQEESKPMFRYAAKFLRFGIFPPQISDSCTPTDGTAKSLVRCKEHLVL